MFFSTKKITDLVDNILAKLEPKPHLYTFFTFKSPASGQSFTAGMAYVGTTCLGYLAELYGDKIHSHYHQESLRTSINMYASGFSDLDVAEVNTYINIFSNN